MVLEAREKDTTRIYECEHVLFVEDETQTKRESLLLHFVSLHKKITVSVTMFICFTYGGGN